MPLALTPSPSSRIALGLAVAALMVALLMAYLMLNTAVLIARMSAWPTVPATLDEVELHHPGSATSRSRSVGARYHYVIDGHTYTATRVSVYSPDSLGSFFQHTYDDLHTRLERGETVPAHVKQIYLDTPLTGTVVTKAIDGAPQRVIRTKLIDELEKAKLLAFPKALNNALKFRKLTSTSYRDLLKEGLAMKKSQDLTWSQLALAANAPMLTKAAIVDGHPEVGILPTGQGVGAIDTLPSCQEIIDLCVQQAIERLDHLCGR